MFDCKTGHAAGTCRIYTLASLHLRRRQLSIHHINKVVYGNPPMAVLVHQAEDGMNACFAQTTEALHHTCKISKGDCIVRTGSEPNLQCEFYSAMCSMPSK